MAAAEVPVPSEHFTQIKEQKLKPGDLEEEKEEGGVQRMEAQEGAVEAEAVPCQLLDAAAGLQKDQPELPLWVPAVESDRRVLTLQTVHLTSQDVQLQGLGWLSVPHSEFPVTIPQEESFLPLPSVLWLEQESQPSLQHCMTVSIPEELYQPEDVGLTHFQLLQQSVPAAEEDPELTPNSGGSAAQTKVWFTLTHRCLVGKRKVKLIFPRSRLWAILRMDKIF